MADQANIWAGRFTVVTFILGGIAWLVLAVLLLGNILAGLSPPNYALGPASSRIVAGGGAGTWFVMGLLSFLVIGVIGIGLSGTFYRHVESSLGQPLKGWQNIAAWIHLAVGGGAATASSLLMTYGGFQAGAAFISASLGGGGLSSSNPADIGKVHTTILGPLVNPIAILMGIALLGYLIGGFALAAGWFAARRK
ncbi:MAG TPA: hypothetical protein VI999_06445 [Thermoplasmata archaeon]|nr:hypothetical protein [Thermoplasmata archaeon]